MNRYNVMSMLHARIVDCDVLILTLGVIEVWYDREAGCYLNLAPFEAMPLHPERYECHMMSVSDTVHALQDLEALLVRYCRADFRIIVTVSPVPLNLTFSGADV